MMPCGTGRDMDKNRLSNGHRAGLWGWLCSLAAVALLFPSGAFAQCEPGRVTCCLTINNALHKVYIGGVDVTSSVEPQNAFMNWEVAKTISFDEPMYDTTLAIEGFEYQSENHGSPDNSGLQLTCISSRPNSPWNFVSVPDSNWTSVAPMKRNRFPDNWQSLDYSLTSSVVESRSPFELDWSSCSAVGIPQSAIVRSKRVAVASSNGLFSFRRTVYQDPRCRVQSVNRGQARPDPFATPKCGTVTCCLTVDNDLVSLYVNGRDVTSEFSLGSQDGLRSWRATKILTFPEPSSWRIGLGILGRDVQETHAPERSGVQIMCTASRPESRWNDVSSDIQLGSWRSVSYLANNWFAFNYTGPSTPAVASSSKFYIRDATCGPLSRYDYKVAAEEDGSPYFALRLDLLETSPCIPEEGSTPVAPLSIDLLTGFIVSESAKQQEVSSGGWGGRTLLSLDAAEITALNNAKVFWEETIFRSYPTSACIPAGSNVCGASFQTETCFEDLLVIVASSNNLGAKPVETSVCAIDPTGRSRVARIVVNRQMSTSAALGNLMKHALGHAIGFGTLWKEFNLLDSNNKYVGANVLAETNKPVALDDGESPPIHWSTSAVGKDELFTARVTASSAISKISLLSFKDLRLSASTSTSSTSASSSSQQEDFTTTGDVVHLEPLVLSRVMTKPGRAGELAADLEAKQKRDGDRAAATTLPSNNGRMSTPVLVGIVVGSVVGLAAIGLALFVASRRRRPRRSTASGRSTILRRPSQRQSGRIAWIEHFDEENNATYWINRETNEFSWTNPLSDNKPTKPSTTSELVVMAQPEDPDDREAGSDWTMEEDEITKARYFIKPSTGEFSWTLPTPQALGGARGKTNSSQMVNYVMQ